MFGILAIAEIVNVFWAVALVSVTVLVRDLKPVREAEPEPEPVLRVYDSRWTNEARSRDLFWPGRGREGMCGTKEGENDQP